MKKFLQFFLIGFLFTQLGFSQANVENKRLLNEIIQLKQEMTKNYKLKEFYVIQLHSGDKEEAKEIKSDINEFLEDKNKPESFKREVIIMYETPNYKVWVGKFNTRLQADRFFLDLKEDYPNALILKPGLG
ncbi:MAG: SPOR domain-containing protein [Psychroflexus sp.]|nr:SPOR domain-containing protein [Psychroflexus sp.]MDR9448987.1 SPOR domain-containing protein [Psychroflexus sp.]